MLNSRSLLGVRGIAVALFFSAICPGIAAERQVLRGHVPPAVTRFNLQPTGQLPAIKSLQLAIGLPLRNEAALNRLLQQMYDPASPNFRQYLTPEQFTEQFGPREQDYQAVIAFAQANGLTVTGIHSGRTLVDVSGSVADVERVFRVAMHTYRHPEENRAFFAPDAEPSIDLAVPILHISGLDDFIKPRPMNLKITPLENPALVAPAGGSGTNGTYMGNDFRAAYAPGVTLDGSGQVVGLLELDGYHTNDITNYEQQAGLPNVSLQNVYIDSYSGNAGRNNSEVALDIEMAVSMAPGLSQVIVYEEQNGSNVVDMLDRMATDNLAKQISSSWLIGDNPSFDTAYKQFAAQGQTFFQAAGDDGVFYSGIAQWADDTNITLVGGTTLYTTGPGGSWLSEKVWNWYSTGQGTGVGGGGINFNNIPIPDWQQGINMTTNGGSTTLRNVPDVAMTADNVYVVYNNGVSNMFGGTSCAAPLWAGFTALINQQAVAAGRSTVGFINPAVYAIGKSANFTADFHDITVGNNTNLVIHANSPAVPGYDLCTGWGTPTGLGLITALATPDVLGITPSSGFTANGVTSGPFNLTSQTFTLTNSSASSLNWTLINPSVWLGASSSGGTLEANSQTAVTIGLNAAASNLVAGIYPAILTFSNQNSHVPQSLLFTLQSGQSFVQNGGFETGDFYGWTLVGNGITGAMIYNAVVNASSLIDNTGPDFIHSGWYGAFLGDTQIATLSQTLNTFPGQGYLLSFWLANPVSGSVQQFLVNWNTNSPGTNRIYYLTNPPVMPWTNITMVVTATGTNATLQFGAENDPDGFGLDDVTLTPIPAPSFRTAVETNNLLKFSWNSLAGVAYQVQYSTNLFKTNWIILSTNAATGSILTFTNSFGTDRQRFYRIRRLP